MSPDETSEAIQRVRVHSGAAHKIELARADACGGVGDKFIKSISCMQLEGPPRAQNEDLNDDDDTHWGLNPLLPKGEIWNLSMKLAASNIESMMLNEQIASNKALTRSYIKAAMVAECLADPELTRLADLDNILQNGRDPKSREEARLWDELDGYEEFSYEDESTIDTAGNATSKRDIVNLLVEELRDQETDTHIAKMRAYINTRK